ncbi:hypothetical protein PS645_04050 [Pseudomonas fluorescens]|uniref:Acyltransferase 3 domain-containing protein n=1 Tax=Pseudomonas fluorescens TaxID=294 RepID=A0A5E6VD18_PSEFL|nr:acyltransferase [Pseudomonas fluorescens]VVN16052.1 hypothetical protein PS645_04050 [Pseudomonas fluorescens]
MSPPLHALTSLRFIAAIMVLFSHLGFAASSESDTIRWLYVRFFYEGYIGVTFFFILSGFILSYSYDQKSKANKIDFIDFMSARIARIYPLHILTLLLAVPISVMVSLKMTPLSNAIDTFLLNASLTQSFSYSQETYFSFNAPSWSLSVEMFFYLLFPVFIRMKTTHIIFIALFILALKYCTDRDAGSTPIHYIMYIAPGLRVPDFILGLILFRIFDKYNKPDVMLATALQFSSLILLAVAFYFGKYVDQNYKYDTYYMIPMGLTVLAFSYQNGCLARGLSNKALVTLGEASFALYLIHQLVIRHGELLRLSVFDMTGPTSEIFFIVIYAASSIGLSYFLFTRFEMRAKTKTLNFLRAMRNPKSDELSSHERVLERLENNNSKNPDLIVPLPVPTS